MKYLVNGDTVPYMTDEQKDAQLGRLIREHKDLTNTIASLRAEARRIGGIYSSVGRVLSGSPENLIFDKESHDIRFSERQGFFLQPREIDAKRLLELTNEIRESIVKQSQIARELKTLGHDA